MNGHTNQDNTHHAAKHLAGICFPMKVVLVEGHDLCAPSAKDLLFSPVCLSVQLPANKT